MVGGLSLPPSSGAVQPPYTLSPLSSSCVAVEKDNQGNLRSYDGIVSEAYRRRDAMICFVLFFFHKPVPAVVTAMSISSVVAPAA